MRRGVLFLLLASCAGPPAGESDDPAALLDLLDHRDPLRREEAAHRLSIAGLTIPENRDTEGLRAGIARAVEERDPQRMIWRAYHALRAGCLARDWARLSDALSRQGFKLVEIYEP